MLKNVVIVIDAAHVNGGAAKVALSSAVGLKKCGCHVVVVCAIPPIDKSLVENGVRVVCTNQYDILSNPSRIQAAIQGIWNTKAKEVFEQVLSEYSPEDTLIHFHEWSKALSASLWSVVQRSGYKMVVTLHEYFLFCPNGGLYNYRQKRICDLRASSFRCYLSDCDSRNYLQKLWRDIRQTVQNRTIRKCSNISFICISETNRKVSHPYLNDIADNWFYLRNPVEVNHSEKVDIANNDTYLYVGRLSPEKGVELFCKALTELNLKGCVIGDGPLSEKLRRIYPNIRFTGWITGDAKMQEIRKGKALVFPSLWYEGAPLTIVEMEANGLPCIVPDNCSASEEIVDGETGFIFKSGDLDSLKEAIRKMEMGDLKALQASLMSAFDPGRYSLKTHCIGLLDIYYKVMNQ